MKENFFFDYFFVKLQSKPLQNISIVNYDDEPDYEKEYEEVPPEINAQMSNDFVSAVNEIEEPEEYEAIEDESIDLADLGSLKTIELN